MEPCARRKTDGTRRRKGGQQRRWRRLQLCVTAGRSFDRLSKEHSLLRLHRGTLIRSICFFPLCCYISVALKVVILLRFFFCVTRLFGSSSLISTLSDVTSLLSHYALVLASTRLLFHCNCYDFFIPSSQTTLFCFSI